MTYKLTAIVSGGQTGADRGGLQAAIDLGLGWGGWSPAGWKAEDGEIPEIYRVRMQCTTSSDYGMRTRLNVQDSDGTLLVSFEPELTGGSAFTEKTCERTRKPYLHLVLPDRGKTRVPDEVRAGVLEWISDCRISVLNVAGPRESKSPGLQEAVRDLLVWIFEPNAPDVAPVEHAIGCDRIGSAGFNCMGCQRDLCWGCEMPLPEGHEIKTAVHWCKADACRAAEARERGGTFTIPVAEFNRKMAAGEVRFEHEVLPRRRFELETTPGSIDPAAQAQLHVVADADMPAAITQDMVRNFIANCENATALLPTVSAELRSGAVVEVKALVELFYTFPNNGAGGSLHVVLDDGNAERENVEYCLKYAEQNGDAAGAALARLLLALTDEEREAL